MQSKAFISLLFLIGIVLGCSDIALSQQRPVQEKKKKGETTWEEFYRQGGKITKAKVIYQNAELTTSDISEGRDLKDYESVGHFSRGGLFYEERSQFDLRQDRELGTIRELIWKMWSCKRKGYIRITYHGGDSITTEHIFVEPDQNAKWHVAWRMVRHTSDIVDLPNIVTLERTRPNSLGSFVLIFKDSSGNEIERL